MRFEASKSTVKLTKWKATIDVEITRTHRGRAKMTMSPRVSRLCTSSCHSTPKYYQVYEIIWRTIPLWICKIIQRPRLSHMTYCDGTSSWYHHTKQPHQLGKLKKIKMETQAERRYQGTISDHYQMSRATTAIKWGYYAGNFPSSISSTCVGSK